MVLSGWRIAMLAGVLASLAVTMLGQSGPAFEVATIKPAAPSPDGHTHIIYPPDGRFSAINITLVALMEWAYSMPSRQILDGPGWLGSTRFDIQAKSDEATDGRIRKATGEEGREIKRGMVQALLAERYGLKVHTETRVLPAYDLVVAKGGSKLPLTKSDGKTFGTGRNYFHAQGLNMMLIAEQLSQITGRVVVDKTGLPDRYDVKLEWTPDSALAGEGSAPELFTAIQEQLGLKLDAAKEPVPVLVIDHIDAPSAN